MTREAVGYLLLALLIGSVIAGIWYLYYTSQRSTWMRKERRHKKARARARTAKASET